MIVEFSVKNFRSINELQTLSFASSGLKSSTEFSYIDTNNINSYGDTKLFNTLGIYGPNASGKSNIVKALDYFINVITSQPTAVSNLQSLCQPFLFQDNPEETESYFQLVIILGETKYRYGLTVKKNSENKNLEQRQSTEIVTNEWLYSNKGKNMSPLFIREGKRIIKNTLQNKSKIPQSIPFEHTLFLTHASAFDTNGDCNQVSDYLRRFYTSDFETKHDKFRWMSIIHIDSNEELKIRFKTLLTSFNLKYDDIFLEKEKDIEIDHTKVFPLEKISFVKEFRQNEKVQNVNLNLLFHESSGTQKMFDLAGLLLQAFGLNQSAFIILDEIDSNFHPSLLVKLVGLFNDPEINRSKSQLLFTSHDTNLMSPAIMRRDQFYFTEKQEDNSTRLYSLADLKGIRNDADFAKQYLAGYYGALPMLEKYCDNQIPIDNE
jgi:uncharacterized protein